MWVQVSFEHLEGYTNQMDFGVLSEENLNLRL